MKKKFLLSISLVFLLSCEAIFVDDISSETIELLAPSNNVEVPSGDVQFNWMVLENAEQYRIQIATPDFQNATQILMDSVLSSTSIIKNLNAGDYSWRVQGENSGYTTSFSTNTFKVN